MQLLLYEQESIIKWLTIIVCLCLYKCLLKKLVWKRLLHQKNIPFRNCSKTPQEAPFANRPPLTYHWCTIVKVTCAYSHFHLAPESIQILVMCWYLGPKFWDCSLDTGILCSCGDLNAVRSSIYGKPRPSNYDSQMKTLLGPQGPHGIPLLIRPSVRHLTLPIVHATQNRNWTLHSLCFFSTARCYSSRNSLRGIHPLTHSTQTFWGRCYLQLWWFYLSFYISACYPAG